jgi:Uma2 family endonuclease
MVIQSRAMTAEAFDLFADQPENMDKILEFIGGEVVEVPSNPYASETGYNFGFAIKLHLKQRNLKGHVTGEAGGYKVYGERYAPHVGYVSAEKQLYLDQHGYNHLPPDLAVEVEFPTSAKSERQLRIKLANYLAAGTVIWVAYPETREVEIYVPGQPVKILGIDDTIDGGEVLPGFTLAVKDVFPDMPESSETAE